MIYCLQENGYNQRLSYEVDKGRLRKINITFFPICGFLDFIKIQKSFYMAIWRMMEAHEGKKKMGSLGHCWEGCLFISGCQEMK